MDDRGIIIMDAVEFFFRRLACRVVGHAWEPECEEAGGVVYTIGHSCKRCYRSEVVGRG